MRTWCLPPPRTPPLFLCLAGLVDYENQALLRSLVRDAKHKTMYRIKIDSLEQERAVLDRLEKQILRDNEAGVEICVLPCVLSTPCTLLTPPDLHPHWAHARLHSSLSPSPFLSDCLS